jgi:hypothetical protein
MNEEFDILGLDVVRDLNLEQIRRISDEQLHLVRDGLENVIHSFGCEESMKSQCI